MSLWRMMQTLLFTESFVCLLLFGIFAQHFWYLVLCLPLVCTFCLLQIYILPLACVSVFLDCAPFLWCVCASSLIDLFWYFGQVNLVWDIYTNLGLLCEKLYKIMFWLCHWNAYFGALSLIYCLYHYNTIHDCYNTFCL